MPVSEPRNNWKHESSLHKPASQIVRYKIHNAFDHARERGTSQHQFIVEETYTGMAASHYVVKQYIVSNSSYPPTSNMSRSKPDSRELDPKSVIGAPTGIGVERRPGRIALGPFFRSLGPTDKDEDDTTFSLVSPRHINTIDCVVHRSQGSADETQGPWRPYRQSNRQVEATHVTVVTPKQTKPLIHLRKRYCPSRNPFSSELLRSNACFSSHSHIGAEQPYINHSLLTPIRRNSPTPFSPPMAPRQKTAPLKNEHRVPSELFLPVLDVAATLQRAG